MLISNILKKERSKLVIIVVVAEFFVVLFTYLLSNNPRRMRDNSFVERFVLYDLNMKKIQETQC